MSAEVFNTRRLEPALRYMAENGNAKVAVAAAKFLPEGVKLAAFTAALWDWFRKYNMGRPGASVTRIGSALAQEKDLPAPAKEKIRGALERTARVPLVTRAEVAAQEDREPNSAPNTPPKKSFDPDDGSDPWLKRQKRPRAFAVIGHRSRLELLAEGNTLGLLGPPSWWAARNNWFGTSTPAPEKVKRFLEWFDGLQAKPSQGRISTTLKSAAAAGRKAAGTEPEPTARPRVSRANATAPAAAGDGWQEIEAVCGGCADYDARYSGAETKAKRLGFTKRASEDLAKLGFAVGKFVRAWWNPTTRQLALSLAGNGFKIRSGKHAFCIAGAGLLPVLGKKPLEFKVQPAVKGYDAVLGVIGGAS